MGLFYLTLLGFLFCSLPVSLVAKFPESVSHKILYISTQSIQQALEIYLDALDTYADHDFFVLRKIGEDCLKQGIRSSDPQTRKSTIIGAGLAGSSEALDVLSQAMETPDPLQQLLVLSAVSGHLGKTSDELLFKALASPYPIIRLEAAYRLANLKNTRVIDHLHSFIHKLPEEIQCLSAAIFLCLETEESDAYIRDLLAAKKSSIRSATALLIGEYQQKRFLPTLRNLLTSASPQDQEAVLYALGKLKDGQSYYNIKKQLQKTDIDVTLAAAQALIALGKEEDALPVIKKQALEERPRALYALRHLPSEIGIPIALPIFLKTKNSETKLNAALALLELGCDAPELIEYITDWLVEPHYNETLTLSFSKGHTLQNWKRVSIIVPQDRQEKERLLSTARVVEEQILTFLFRLPKEAYLPCIYKLLASQKTQLAATAISFLSHISNQKALDLLFQAAKLPGEPIIRAYADLAIYNLTKDPEKKRSLHDHARNLIQKTLLFVDTENQRPNPKMPYLRYQVTPESRTKLMLDILETLAISKSFEDIRLLIQLMAEGHVKNFPILAGLLIKIVE
ncbi:HEAT repeat domain-containing protein [Candidatus Chlamydia corallus]|uniref:HEAT repeat domain-containing protein n=1 Tax=Candidatus Chlamydia corallus TaxID=2038470 RepID=UPI000C2FD7F1|nr:HEAT repeat domain-containing protein [Candidatus Chlamydia corallus]